MKVFYQLLYHRMAWSYDLVAWTVSLGMWKEWVAAVIPYLEGPRVLELGHGPGHLQRRLLEQSGSFSFVAGLDRSPQMSHMARRRLARRGLQPALVNGEAQCLPFAEGAFDQVVATFPTEYIANPNTLDEIKRILAPGGQIVALPLAWITGKRARQRAAAALFRITGQAPAWDDRALQPAIRAGFETRVEWIHLESSTLAIIIAIKNL